LGLIIGELVYVAASVAFLADLKDPARGRTALRALHLLFVLVGLEVALAVVHRPEALTAGLPWVPGWTGPVLAGGNLFGLAIVPLLALKSYPERRAAMVSETFGPFLFGLALSGARVALDGDGPMTWQAPILEALTFLGLHHAVLFSVMLALALVRPPFHAAAARLPLTARLLSGFGLFFLTLIALWACQAGLALALHGAAAFANGLAAGLVSLALLLTSVAGSARTLLPTLTSLGPRARVARE
jgi:hypothetical protein